MSASIPRLVDLLAFAELFNLKVISQSASDDSAPWITIEVNEHGAGIVVSVFNGEIVAHGKLPIPDQFQEEIPDRSDNHHFWKIKI
jgi:hypothetical protein